VSASPDVMAEECLGDLAARRERSKREEESFRDPPWPQQNLNNRRFLTSLVISVEMAYQG
jgi:hypothetical protein